MIELIQNRLVFSFPEIHQEAKLEIEFQRTLRIPDDENTYSLPPGLGTFPLHHVDDHAINVPSTWLQHGGVMLPMYQSEALWLRFTSNYPIAIKVATGKRCAVSGEAWQEGIQQNPQNYIVAPQQPWLDGYVIERGVIRQFVAMPHGEGYTAEEQITGTAEHGGIQLAAYPMKKDVFEKRFPSGSLIQRRAYDLESSFFCCHSMPSLGLAPGGRMKQEIYEDPYNLDEWQVRAGSRCFVHLCNSLIWQSVTGSAPPHPAPTASSYSNAGLPWFEYYDESLPLVDGTTRLNDLKSIQQKSSEKGTEVLPENESVTPNNLVVYRRGLSATQIREGSF